MSLFLPFNFNSGQTLVVTAGNSTIPAGKYAYLSAHCTNGETLIIDGTQAQTGGSSVTAVAFSQSVVGTTTAVSVPSDGVSYFTGIGFTTDDAAGSISVGGISIFSGPVSQTETIYAGPGQDVDCSVGTGGKVTRVAGYVKIDGADTTQGYWLSEGTVLTGTATKTITLFNIT